MPETVEAIVFDLGGVIYDIDIKLAEAAFRKLGVENFQSLYNLQQQSSLFDRLERGEITEAGFCEEVSQLAGLSCSSNDISAAWRALLIGFPQDNIQLLNELRQRYPLYLLSNTNEIHISGFEKQLKAQHGHTSLDELFDQVFYSCRMGMRKPQPEIFHAVAEAVNLSPGQFLFLDDHPHNIAAAQEAGWQVIHVPHGERPRKLLEEYLLSHQ